MKNRKYMEIQLTCENQMHDQFQLVMESFIPLIFSVAIANEIIGISFKSLKEGGLI